MAPEEMFTTDGYFPDEPTDNGVLNVDILTNLTDGADNNTSLFDNVTDLYDSQTTEYYEYYEYYYFKIYPFETVTLGMIWPSLVILTMMTNVFVVGYFMSRKNRGKATNLLFVSIALSDTLTGLSLIPNALDIYAKNNTDLSASVCELYMISRFYVSRVFHTVSVWQTVLLGVQRYICVCHPFISARICTFWKTFISIVVMYFLAAIMHIYHIVDDKLGLGTCRWKIEDVCKESCMYLWFCIVFQHFVPCILLLTLTILTLVELNKAYKRVSAMPGRAGSKRSSRDRVITITATLIVIVFLVPELPHGIYKVVFTIAQHTKDRNMFDPEINHIFIAVYEMVLVLSFNANFWIYCAMMHDFRKALIKVVTFNTVKRGISRMRLLSWSGSRSSRHGSVRTSVSRTSSIASRHRILSLTTSVHSADPVHGGYPLTPTKAEAQQKFYQKSRSTAETQDELNSTAQDSVTQADVSVANGDAPTDDMQDDVFL